MNRTPRGSALLIVVIITLLLAVIGVGLLRFSHRSVASAVSGPKHLALVECAEAGRALIDSRFHLLGLAPTAIDVMNENVDGVQGRMRAAGGHIDADPSRPAAEIAQIEPLPDEAVSGPAKASVDITNIIGSVTAGVGGQAYKVVVHCQMGDLSSPTSGRQLEIEYGVRFGL